MIKLNRHIEILLLSNDCVIVPNFGGFVAHHVDARYDESDGTYLPPYRTLGFNSQLKVNDHLLVQSYIEAYDISYPEALQRINDEVEELKQHLENEGEYEFNDLGVLSLNSEGNYLFTPCESGILSPDLYGLTLFMVDPLDELPKQKVEEPIAVVEEKEDDSTAEIVELNKEKQQDETLIIKMSWLRNAAVVAAAIIMFFFISSPVHNSQMPDVLQSSVLPVVNTTGETDNEKMYEQSSTQAAPTLVENAAQSEEGVQEEEPDVYSIVIASRTSRKHAEEFIERISKDSLNDARIVKMNNTENVRVIYSTFTSEEDARQALRELRLSHYAVFDEAWVLKIK